MSKLYFSTALSKHIDYLFIYLFYEIYRYSSLSYRNIAKFSILHNDCQNIKTSYPTRSEETIKITKIMMMMMMEKFFKLRQD